MVPGTVIPTMPRQALEAQVTYALMTALPSSSPSDVHSLHKIN